MPFYNFKNTLTDEEFEDQMTIAEKEKYLVENPHIIQLLSKLNIADPFRLGRYKPSSDFRDHLKNIRQKVPGANFNIL